MATIGCRHLPDISMTTDVIDLNACTAFSPSLNGLV